MSRDREFQACEVCERLVDPWTMCECGKCESCAEGCPCGHEWGCTCEACVDRAAGSYASMGGE